MSNEARKCKDGPVPPFTAVRQAHTDRELLNAIEQAWEPADHPVLRQLSLAVREARAPRREALAEFRRLGEALDQAKANGQAMVGLDLLRQRFHLHGVWAFTKEELQAHGTLKGWSMKEHVSELQRQLHVAQAELKLVRAQHVDAAGNPWQCAVSDAADTEEA